MVVLQVYNLVPSVSALHKLLRSLVKAHDSLSTVGVAVAHDHASVEAVSEEAWGSTGGLLGACCPHACLACHRRTEAAGLTAGCLSVYVSLLFAAEAGRAAEVPVLPRGRGDGRPDQDPGRHQGS